MYDIAVLGGGPGGYTAAIRASQMGAKVCLIEESQLGGTCLNEGCIPTKALLESAHILHRIRHAEEFGIDITDYHLNFSKMLERKNTIVSKLGKGLLFLIKKNKIDLIQKRGVLHSKNEIKILDETSNISNLISAQHIIIATGSSPAQLTQFPYNSINILTSTDLLTISSIPKSLLIIGGGIIGCEFASMFYQLGSSVTIVDTAKKILSTEDGEISDTLMRSMKKQRIKLFCDTAVNSLQSMDDCVKVSLSNGEEIEVEKVLVSVGRTPKTDGLGLENVGIELGTKREILVNSKLQTSVPNIYGVGDVNGKSLLAHAAASQGISAVENILGHESYIDKKVIPSCIFTTPEIASVGLTTEKAQQLGLSIKISKFPFSANGKANCLGELEGFVKILSDATTKKILGVHIIGLHASDLIAEAALAVQQGLIVPQFTNTVHAHPTLSETLFEAAEAALNLSIHI